MTAEAPSDEPDPEALAWAARLDSERTGRADWIELKAWLAADPARLLRLARAEATLASAADAES